MGGSSFIFTCFAIGIILSVASNVEQVEKPEQTISKDDSTVNKEGGLVLN